jgi:hypothetical protein
MTTTDTVYQLKIHLRGVTPMVWRRVLIKASASIADLHAIIQAVMGWEDLHLHQFHIHGKTYGIYRDGGMHFRDDPRQVRLHDFKLRQGERFLYDYDMGDFWDHEIRLERIVPLEPRKKYPVCTGGHGDCPPEDCGGPSGFMSLMEQRSSWFELEQVREDVLLIGQRLLDFYDGGPRPTYEDSDLVEALERINDREENAPISFKRREVNAVLRKLIQEETCTSASK